MPKHIAPLLLGLVSIALMAQTSAPTITPAEREANLKGCADLGLITQPATDPSGWNYWMPSPAGTYVARGQHLGSHSGCYLLNIYQCTTQQAAPGMGCEGISYDAGSWVFAKEWVSDDELLITQDGKTQSVNVRGYFKTDPDKAKAYDQVLGLSPDGQWQVFSSYRDGMPELYRMHPDGSAVQRLTRSLGIENYFGWSADGQWIIFDYAKPQDYRLLPYKMRLDGSELQPLMTEAETDLSQDRIWKTLALSPDAKWLLMQGNSLDPKSATKGLNYVIYRLGVAAGGLTRLTDRTYAYWFQDWSPDGRALVWKWTGNGQERSFELIDVATAKNTSFVVGNYAEFQRWTDDRKAALFLIYDATTGTKRWYQAELDGSGMWAIKLPAS